MSWSLTSSWTGVNIGLIQFPLALGEVISSTSDPDSPVDVSLLLICSLRKQNSKEDKIYIYIYMIVITRSESSHHTVSKMALEIVPLDKMFYHIQSPSPHRWKLIILV